MIGSCQYVMIVEDMKEAMIRMVNTTLSRFSKTEKKYSGLSARIAYHRISPPPSTIYAQILTDMHTSTIIIIAAVRIRCIRLTKNDAIQTKTLSTCVMTRKGLYAHSRKTMPCAVYSNAASAVMRYRFT